MLVGSNHEDTETEVWAMDRLDEPKATERPCEPDDALALVYHNELPGYRGPRTKTSCGIRW